jgi:hypothetical protein
VCEKIWQSLTARLSAPGIFSAGFQRSLVLNSVVLVVEQTKLAVSVASPTYFEIEACDSVARAFYYTSKSSDFVL